MKRILLISAALLLSGGGVSPLLSQTEPPKLRVGGPSCLTLLDSFNLPVRLETEGGRITAENARRVERLMLDIRQALQGKRCALRFDELFRPADDSLFFPLATYALAVPPENTYRELALYDSAGRRLGVFEARLSIEKEPGIGETGSVIPFYYLHYRNPSGEVTSSGNRLLSDDFFVRWEDLARRWALDTYSNGEDLLLSERIYP